MDLSDLKKEDKGRRVMELLAKVQMDDHKDAQMLTDWAEDARELGYPQVAAYLASRAKSRISGASDINRHLEEVGREVNLSDGDRHGDDMWRRIHRKCMDEDCERMKSKLEKISSRLTPDPAPWPSAAGLSFVLPFPRKGLGSAIVGSMKRRSRQIARAGIFGSVDNPQVVLAQDLREIAETWPDIQQAPIKLGGHWVEGNPRLGNVVSVRFDELSQSLWAEIDEHDQLAKAVDEDGYYPDVSIGAKARASDGKMYLHHLAYLGDEPPAVKALYQQVAQELGGDLPIAAADDGGRLWQLPSAGAKPLYLSDSPPGDENTPSKSGEGSSSFSSPEEDTTPKKEMSMTEDEIELMRAENERLAAELAQKESLLADQSQRQAAQDKAELESAVDGRLTRQEKDCLMELADLFQGGKALSLSDGKTAQELRPVQFLARILARLPQPVEPGVLDLSDPAPAEPKENLARKMMGRM